MELNNANILKYKKTGDETLFNELYKDYTYLRKKLIKNVFYQDLEDVYAECDVTFIKCIKLFDIESGVKFSSYLSKALLNTRLNYYHKNVFNNTLQHLEDNITDELKIEDVIPDDVDYFSQYEDSDYIDYLLSFLDERDRKVVELYFFENKTQREVGQVLGLSQPLIKKDLDRILDFLKYKNFVENCKK